MSLNTSQTFECAFYPDDTLSVEPSNYISHGAFLEITNDDGRQNVQLTKKQVKKLRKALKECLKPKDEPNEICLQLVQSTNRSTTTPRRRC